MIIMENRAKILVITIGNDSKWGREKERHSSKLENEIEVILIEYSLGLVFLGERLHLYIQQENHAVEPWTWGKSRILSISSAREEMKIKEQKQ